MSAAHDEPGLFDRLRTWVCAQSGWRRALLAFVAGSLSVLAFAPVFLSPILFVTFPVLVWLIDRSPTVGAAAFAVWCFAFGYFFFNLFWIGEAFLVEADKFAVLLPFAVTLLPAGLALFWALAGAAARKIWTAGPARVLLFVIALSIAEWLRGHLFTGLPWNVPGYALTYPLPLMQGAALFGVYGLTPLALVIFTWPLVTLADHKIPSRDQLRQALLVPLVPLIALFAFGTWRLSTPTAYVDGVKIRIVQPSVPQREKWQPQFQGRIFEDHLLLSRTDADGRLDDAAGVTHIFWPEAAMPFFPLERPEVLQRIGQMLTPDRVLITGAMRREATAIEPGASRKAYNSLVAFDQSGKAVAIYDKIRLVPFGEYLPFQTILSSLGLMELAHGHGSFGSGIEPRPLFTAPGFPPAIGLICYEALFPGAANASAGRSRAIINVTNDGWFGNTSGPRQHFFQTRVRAVEDGLPIIRTANNGISAIVDAYGRVLSSADMDVRGVIDSRLPSDLGLTPYVRYGDFWFTIFLVVICVWARRIGLKT